MVIDLDNPENNVNLNSDFPKKFLKLLSEDFINGAQSKSTDELKKVILESERHIYETNQALENDEKLAELKFQVKEASAPYKETRAGEAAKIAYALYILEGRGVAV